MITRKITSHPNETRIIRIEQIWPKMFSLYPSIVSPVSMGRSVSSSGSVASFLSLARGESLAVTSYIHKSDSRQEWSQREKQCELWDAVQEWSVTGSERYLFH